MTLIERLPLIRKIQCAAFFLAALLLSCSPLHGKEVSSLLFSSVSSTVEYSPMSVPVATDEGNKALEYSLPKPSVYKAELLPDFGASAVGLPPVPKDRVDVYRYYKLQFMQDSYPGIVTEKGVIAHPIYGSYLIAAYLYKHNLGQDGDNLNAAVRVADAALNRMKYITEYDALGFYYTEEEALTYYPNDFISGLTQARYLMPFIDLYEATGNEDYKIAAHRIFNSLKIPQSEGGVLINTPYGIAVEEYPHEIPTYVLNGWTTVILKLLEYSQKSGDMEARDFGIANLKTVEQLLPLYDYPTQFLSRYQLTGFVYFKVIFDKPRNCKVDNFQTLVSHEWHSMKTNTTNRWDNYVATRGLAQDKFAEHRQINLNGVFSRIDNERRFRLDLLCRDEGTAKIYIANGDYRPDLSSMQTKRWIYLDTVKIKAGMTKSSIQFDSSHFPMLGYPTNFAKKIGGQNYNVYHWLHVNNFQQIKRHYSSDIFDYYEIKWREYVREWPKVPALDKPNYSFENPSVNVEKG